MPLIVGPTMNEDSDSPSTPAGGNGSENGSPPAESADSARPTLPQPAAPAAVDATTVDQPADDEPKAPAGRFGAFGGVFTPCVLTILGVIMFMRVGFVTGHSGCGWPWRSWASPS